MSDQIINKSICPDCGGSVEPIVTSIGTGYYCASENKMIGDYFTPSRKDLHRRMDREVIGVKILVISPIIIFLVWMANAVIEVYARNPDIGHVLPFIIGILALSIFLMWIVVDMNKITRENNTR